MQRRATGGGGGGGGVGDDVISQRLGKLSGEIFQAAYMSTARGDPMGGMGAAEAVIQPGQQELAIVQAKNGVSTALQDQATTVDGVRRLRSMLNNRSLSPEVRVMIQSALSQVGQLQYGSNQLPGANTIQQGVEGGTSGNTPQRYSPIDSMSEEDQRRELSEIDKLLGGGG